jgi:putative nucleotidyltransferase with HDIG domain
MDRVEAEKVIRRVEELPTLPAVITRILEVVENEQSSVKDLERVISRDQSIASKVLKIANSAYYGFPREITTLHRAITILGFRTVWGLALGSSIFDTFFRANGESAFDRTTYWLHSIACSRCALTLAGVSGGMDSEEAFLAGLIHDIGMVVMDHVMHEKYCQVLESAIQQELPFDQLERKAWGFDHGEVGAWLGEEWKFPLSLLEAIRFHHRGPEAGGTSNPLISVIHIADFCASEAGLDVTGNQKPARLQEKALNTLNLSGEDLTDLTKKTSDGREQIEAFFSAMSSL